MKVDQALTSELDWIKNQSTPIDTYDSIVSAVNCQDFHVFGASIDQNCDMSPQEQTGCDSLNALNMWDSGKVFACGGVVYFSVHDALSFDGKHASVVEQKLRGGRLSELETWTLYYTLVSCFRMVTYDNGSGTEESTELVMIQGLL
jgi:hypothetical protein